MPRGIPLSILPDVQLVCCDILNQYETAWLQ